jgi:hypothetical protein
MRLPTEIFARVVCALCIAGSAPAWADDAKPAANPCSSGTYDQRLASRYSADAAGNLTCLPPGAPVTQSLAGWTDQIRENSATFPVRLRLARAELVRQRAAANALAGAAANDEPFAAKVVVIQKALDEAVKEIDTILAKGGNIPEDFSRYPALEVDYWKLRGLSSTEPHGAPFQYLQDKRCINITPSASCDAAYTNAVELGDQIFIVARIVSLLQSTERGKLLDDAKTREDHWHAYLYDTQFQFWWELALNYAVEKRCPVFMRWDCTPPKTDEHGNELGFRDPPQNKLILLHPDVAVEYLHREPAGQRFKPVIAFQWFGYQRWDWQGEGVSHLMGVALVSTVADTSVSKRVGTGLMLQWKRFALAITGRPKEVGVAINLNVVDWIGSVNPGWESKLKAPLTQ